MVPGGLDQKTLVHLGHFRDEKAEAQRKQMFVQDYVVY
jgi:hypothetical protein